MSVLGKADQGDVSKGLRMEGSPSAMTVVTPKCDASLAEMTPKAKTRSRGTHAVLKNHRESVDLEEGQDLGDLVVFW